MKIYNLLKHDDFDIYKNEQYLKFYLKAFFITTIVLFLGIILTTFAHSERLTPKTKHTSIKESLAIACILGESRLEYMKHGYSSLLAVAEALRNRGTTQGVYGCKVNLTKEMAYIKLKGVDIMAKKAWEESKYSNLVNGATHWENITAFGKPSWAKKMKQTAKIGNHVFYKEIKK